MNLSKIIALCILIWSSNSFILSTLKGYRKCFTTDVSPDKTLQVRFGFPRRQRQNCQFRLEVSLTNRRNYNENQGKQIGRQRFFMQDFFCYQMNPREPYVFKHTPHKEEYAGSYEICVENVDNFNNNETLAEVVIAERYDPTLYADTMDTIPLVGSAYLKEIQEIVMNIKQSLSYSQTNIKHAEQIGDRLTKIMAEADNLTKKALYFQLLFLIGYGVVWCLFIWGLYEKWRK